MPVSRRAFLQVTGAVAGAGIDHHGFKHGLVVGEYIAERALGKPADPELQALFKLKAATF